MASSLAKRPLRHDLTPPIVGFARKPPVFLRPGDGVEVEIERIGMLRNPVAGE